MTRGGDLFQPFYRDINLTQHENFEKSLMESLGPIRDRKARRSRERSQPLKNKDKPRSRSPTSSEWSDCSVVEAMPQTQASMDSVLPLGQQPTIPNILIQSNTAVVEATPQTQVSTDTQLPLGQPSFQSNNMPILVQSNNRVMEVTPQTQVFMDTQLPLGQSSLQSNFKSPPAHLIADTPGVPEFETQTPTTLLTPIGRERYNSSDQGPFVTHVQRVETAPDSGTVLHPVSFGLFLQNRKREFPNVVEGSIKRIGRNRIALSFHSAEDANLFLESPSLIQHKFRAFIPSFIITRLGLVRGVPADWSPEEVLENLKIPTNCGTSRAIKIRRLNFKKKRPDGSFSWLPSETVVVTFDGQTLPKKIFLCLNSLTVEQYQLPTIQCFQCCRFGHTREKCRSLPRCFRCGGAHLGESCSVENDSDRARCCNCLHDIGAGHFATSKSCPEFTRQSAIKKTMADRNVSYMEASNIHVKSNKKSYANVTAVTPQHLGPETPSTSYKKTVLRNPRATPSLSKGYDRKAHNALTKDPVVQSGPVYMDNSPYNEHSIRELIKLISMVVKVFSPSSPLADPSLLSHAAPLISSLLSNSNYGQSNPTVELS